MEQTPNGGNITVARLILLYISGQEAILNGRVTETFRGVEFAGVPFFGVGRAGLLSGYPAVS
jgi:hypothetical protein